MNLTATPAADQARSLTVLTLASTRQLALYAFLIAASRFIPVPFVDDLLPERLRRRLVAQLLRQHGRTYSEKLIEPVWADPSGCLSGCMGWVILVPFKLLLFPIRKFLAILGAAREVSQRMASTLLLGHTLLRALQQGLFPEGADAGALSRDAERFQRVFEYTMGNTNLTLFGSPIQAALSSSKGLIRAGARLGRRLASRTEPTDEPETNLPAEERHAVEGMTGLVDKLLARPEIAALVQDFDARFWAAWAQSQEGLDRYGAAH